MSNWLFKKDRLLATTLLAGLAFAGPAFAQQASEEEDTGIVITGTRIQAPGIVSSSPIQTIGAQELEFQQVTDVEQVIRNLPSVIPGDGQNVNNGTVGATTINLRGIGDQRNVILVDGKRLTPYDINGVVDVSQIPLALLERIDVITGGGSAVYGSDAISGAVNFVLKKDFEGVDFDNTYSVTGEGDGKIYGTALTLGSNVADGRGNVVMSMNYAKRESVTLADRPFGIVGVDSASGAGLDGVAPPPPAGCGGPNAVAVGGSTTTVPSRISLAGSALGQFREDSTLGANCNVFNFNPYNYYQTPSEKYGATAVGSFQINEAVEAYSRIMYSASNVRQQIAPSGVFGNLFWVPLQNPFLSTQARNSIITQANALVGSGLLTSTNWRDLNANGVVDAADDVNLSIRRRTIEFGERASSYEYNQFQFMAGVRGTLFDNWDWDLSFQRGEVDRIQVDSGYTNVANIANALNAVSTTACRNGDSSCVPINLFGPAGSITAAMAGYSSATALEQRNYQQTIASFTVGGLVQGLQSPLADTPLAVLVGTEYREEIGSATPDECLKLAPTSCLGGAGGNTLPISGQYSTQDFFGEAIFPIATGKPLMENLSLEVGFRTSDYDPSDSTESWKVGVDYSPFQGLRFRAMQQRATRAPNIGELASPLVTGLRNSGRDPCSIAQPVADRTATLQTRCISTGMSALQVWNVQNIVSGQVGTFEGTNLAALPKPEEADTLTFGFVVNPGGFGFIKNPTLSVDYYDIEIDSYIGIPEPQEVLDGCYVRGEASSCAKVIRINGDLATPGAGVQLFTSNLSFFKVEGVEVGAGFGVDLESLGLGNAGALDFAFNANYYLSNEYKSGLVAPVTDCLGLYGSTCDPVHELRFTQRTTWSLGPLEVSYLWRYLSGIDLEEALKPEIFDAFESIDAYHYLDLAGSYSINENAKLTLSVANVLDNDPPIIGNETGTTSYNGGNTFPSNFDTLGRVYAVGLNLRF